MMKFESDIAPLSNVRVIPTGTPDQLDVWVDALDHAPTEQDWADHEEAMWNDDDGLTDAEADAQTLAMAGWGTDEDYGYFGDEFDPPF
jgi:hypothetical protein